MHLATAQIVGYWSAPSPVIAEHNPAAYNQLMAEAPAGAFNCAHCGAAIRHHVIVRDDSGAMRCIGSQCAERVGLDTALVRRRMTTEQAAKDRATSDARRAAAEAAHAERLARRMELVGDIVALLERQGTDFHASLAAQLRHGPLSARQASYAVKAVSDTGRRNKRNADAWDDVLWRLTATDDELSNEQ